MTPITTAANVANTTETTTAAATKQTPMTKDEVKKLLLDAAFVLHMTRRVKAEILAARPQQTPKITVRRDLEVDAGLGV
ncbi:MAG: hypothetical protein U0792_06545 [Gemmataceae bacterium]